MLGVFVLTGLWAWGLLYLVRGENWWQDTLDWLKDILD